MRERWKESGRKLLTAENAENTENRSEVGEKYYGWVL
jgi:hypothetical protein